MVYCMTNLCPNPTFASVSGKGWTRGAGEGWYNSDHFKYGTRAYKLELTKSDIEGYIFNDYAVPLIKGHKYYARIEGYQEIKTTGASIDFYFPHNSEPLVGNVSVKAAGAWQIYGAIADRDEWEVAEAQFRVDFNNNKVAGDIWLDGAMLIDLTETFGEGNEPTVTWCDSNIPFFIGRMATFVKISGTWRYVTDIYSKTNGVYVRGDNLYARVNGSCKTV